MSRHNERATPSGRGSRSAVYYLHASLAAPLVLCTISFSQPLSSRSPACPLPACRALVLLARDRWTRALKHSAPPGCATCNAGTPRCCGPAAPRSAAGRRRTRPGAAAAAHSATAAPAVGTLARAAPAPAAEAAELKAAAAPRPEVGPVSSAAPPRPGSQSAGMDRGERRGGPGDEGTGGETPPHRRT